MKVEQIQGAALPEKERNGQVGQSPDNGSYHSEPYDGAVRCKLSCRPDLWNARESRLDGKSREAVETNAKTGQAAACGQCGVRHAWWSASGTLTRRRSRTCSKAALKRR